MATLLGKTFPADPAGQTLLKNVKAALRNLTGVGDNFAGTYLPPPERLKLAGDELRPGYQNLWQMCSIKFDEDQSGAEMKPNYQMEIGPYFLRSDTTVADLEKLLLHEFLHDALTPSGVGGETGYAYDHTRINHIIRDVLKYPGPPNPVNPSED